MNAAPPIPPPVMAVVALGSNRGDSPSIFAAVLPQLQALSSAPLRVSPFYTTAPVDCPAGSPPFLNAVVGLFPFPEETPETLLGRLQALEKSFGRRPKIIMNEPRPLDLDLIAFGEERRSTPELTLPHPRAQTRRFVLAPLSDIAPDLILPGQRKSVWTLLSELPAA